VLRKVIEELDARQPLGTPPAKPRELMVLTMCVLAHNTLLRSGELLALKRKHLKWVSATEITVIIESSKCNQTGLPEEIICQDYGGLSFVPFMFAYDAANQVRQQDPEGPLFPRDPRVSWSPALSKGLHCDVSQSPPNGRSAGIVVLWAFVSRGRCHGLIPR
jgi:hypothetical protein